MAELVSLAQTTALLAGRGESTVLAMLHGGVADPLDLSVAADSLVHWVNHDHLVVLVGGVLGNPVAIQHTKGTALTSGTLLSNALETAGKFQLVDSLVDWLTIGGTLGHWALAATTADTNSHDGKTLLGLVSKLAGLVRTSGSWGTVDRRELAVMPTSDSQQVAEKIRLLLTVHLGLIFVCSHLGGSKKSTSFRLEIKSYNYFSKISPD